MNPVIIADSSGLISLTSVSDSNHVRAEKALDQGFMRAGSIVIPMEVYSEALNTIGKKKNHSASMQFARIIDETETFLITYSDEKIRQHALNLYRKQKESTSFIDCIVMVTADHYSTKEIFGFDEVFKKNGYSLIP